FRLKVTIILNGQLELSGNVLCLLPGPVDEGNVRIVGMFYEVFTSVPSNFARSEEQNVLFGNIRKMIEDIFYGSKGYRCGARRKFGFGFDTLAGLDHGIAQAFQERIGHVMLFGPIKTLFDLADDFKITQNLAIQTCSYPEHV